MSAVGAGHAAWHPSDSVFYVELPDLPSARREWLTTSVGRVLDDPEIHAAIGALLGEEPLDPWALLEKRIRASVPAGAFDMAMGMLANLSAASMSLQPTETTEASMRGVDRPEELLGAFGMQATLSFTSPSAAEMVVGVLSGALRGQGMELEEETLTWNGVDGATLKVTGAGPFGDGFQLARVGQDLFVVGGVAQLADLKSRFESDAPSMAKSKVWGQGVALFGAAHGTTVVELYSDLSRYLSQWMSADLDPALELVEGLFGVNGAILARGGRWRIAIDKGRYVSDGFELRDEQRPLEQLLERAPLQAEALSFVNPNAVVASAIQFEPEALVRAIRAKTAMEDGDALTRFEATEGVKLGDMLMALGKSATFSMPTPALLAAPDVQLSLALEDRDAFQAGFAGLVAFIGKSLGDNGTISVKEYRDVQLATIDLTMDLGISGLPMDPVKLFTPTIAVLEDRVLIAATQSYAKKVVRAAVKGDVEGHEYLAQVSMPEGVAEFGFADWGKMVGSLYSMGRSFAGMAAGNMDPSAMPFDLSKLPNADLFLRHFSPSLRWERRADGGMLHHSESSFGPDMMLALGVVGALAGNMGPGGMLPIPR